MAREGSELLAVATEIQMATEVGVWPVDSCSVTLSVSNVWSVRIEVFSDFRFQISDFNSLSCLFFTTPNSFNAITYTPKSANADQIAKYFRIVL